MVCVVVVLLIFLSIISVFLEVEFSGWIVIVFFGFFIFFDSVLLVCGNSLVIKLDKDSKKEKKGLLKLFFGVFIKWKFCVFFLVLFILEVELGSVEFFFLGSGGV